MSETPFFKEYSVTGTGHPSGFTYGWVRNDTQSLYVTIDFTPDDTMDGDKDYARVYVKTERGIRDFKVSVPETKWGRPDFTYTDKVAYQHKVYDFAIPLEEIGVKDLDTQRELLLAFAAYGTAGPVTCGQVCSGSPCGTSGTGHCTLSGRNCVCSDSTGSCARPFCTGSCPPGLSCNLVSCVCVAPSPTPTATRTPTATPTPTATIPTATPTPTPTLLGIGEACGSSTECASTFCASGVCCNAACSEDTESCALPGSVGVCRSRGSTAPAAAPWGLVGLGFILAALGVGMLRRRFAARR